MLYGIVDVQFLFFFLFSFFFRHDFVRPISLEPLLAETPNWVCCLVLRSSCALLLTIQFALLFFFSATILSGPYLWHHYSQTPQIECAAWSCGLILHCCLPSSSLSYFFLFFFSGHNFFFFRQDFFFFFLRNFFFLFLFYLFFFCQDFLFLFIIFFFFLQRFFFFCSFFFRSFFFSATILSGVFTSLISSLINIISLLLTTFDWTKVLGIAPRSHTGRPRTCLVDISSAVVFYSVLDDFWCKNCKNRDRFSPIITKMKSTICINMRKPRITTLQSRAVFSTGGPWSPFGWSTGRLLYLLLNWNFNILNVRNYFHGKRLDKYSFTSKKLCIYFRVKCYYSI